MKLNSINIGGGLALVAVGLLANAAASLVGSTEQTANADDLKRAAKNPQSVADVAVSRADEGGAEMVAMGGGCQPIQGESLNWFGPIREIGQCFSGEGLHLPKGAPLTHADVNGDGVPESFRQRTEIVFPASGAQPCAVAIEHYSLDGEAFVAERSCVLPSEILADWIAENTEWSSAQIRDQEWSEASWIDVDKDGDLDLFLLIRCSTGCDTVWRNIWLENTGFQKQTFAAGDINKDGEVDGVDISILLSDWTY